MLESLIAPRPASLFRPVRDGYGLRLALVFGNHARRGLCPYHAGHRCHHCDLGAGEGAAFEVRTNRGRLAWFRQHYADVLPGLAHLVLYNSGSILNPREMPPDMLDELLAFGRELPGVQVVSLDSRETYISRPSLLRAAEALGPGRMLRPILGLESADERVRNRALDKRMPRAAIAAAFAELREAALELGPGRIGLDVNLMLAAPGTTARTALQDAVDSARFALETGMAAGVPVDLNLHPYYPSNRGLARFPDHPRCAVTLAVSAAIAICQVRSEVAPAARLFFGLEDEGHDSQPELRASELARARDALETFNRTQDPAALEPARAAGEGGGPGVG
jgi:hypothetical protein